MVIVLLCALLLPPDGNDDETQPSPSVLLITSDDLAPAWAEFAQWKTRLGKPTKIVTLSTIDEHFDGVDIQDKIRHCVLDSIENHPIRWVILGGDSAPDSKGPVPHRMTQHQVPMKTELPTDLYYLSQTDWDHNDDGVYGDWENDKESISYGSDGVAIGRIPVRTSDDVMAYTAKVIVYESNYPDNNFASTFLYTCPEPHAYPKVRRSWDDYVSVAWPEGSLLRWFANESPWDTDESYDLSPENWVTQISEGCAGKIHIHGHGHLPAWVLNKHKQVVLEHVDQLTNANALPIITTVSCNTGEFDSSHDPCITEAMLRAPDGGAIAIVTPSRPGVPVFSDPRDFQLMMREGKLDATTETMTQFWVHGLEETLTTGEAMAATKADFNERASEHPGYHFIQCELNLLGDPTLDFRAHPPTTPDVSMPKTLEVGSCEITVETGCADASVCLWKADDCYEVVRTGSGGRAVVPFVIKSPGALQVTVSGPGLNAVTKTIDIVDG